MPQFESKQAPAAYDVDSTRWFRRYDCCIASAAQVWCIARLPVGAVSIPVRHRRVEEVWFFLSGAGQVWRKQGEREQVLDVAPGVSLTIPLGTQFQFRNTGAVPLEFVITTTPPWPGEDEAVLLDAGRWELNNKQIESP